MTNKEILNQAMSIVRSHLDYIEEYDINTIKISKSELVCISMALALAGGIASSNNE